MCRYHSITQNSMWVHSVWIRKQTYCFAWRQKWKHFNYFCHKWSLLQNPFPPLRLCRLHQKLNPGIVSFFLSPLYACFSSIKHPHTLLEWAELHVLSFTDTLIRLDGGPPVAVVGVVGCPFSSGRSRRKFLNAVLNESFQEPYANIQNQLQKCMIKRITQLSANLCLEPICNYN